MATFAKIMGWTIAGVVGVKLATSASTGTVINNVLTGWAGILGAISGAGQSKPGG